MEVFDYQKIIDQLREENKSGTDQYLPCDTFTVDVRIGNGVHTPREHICSQDEFTFVMKGEVEMYVDGTTTLLHAGQGLLVKAGVRHKTNYKPDAEWLLISKPHKHHYFE